LISQNNHKLEQRLNIPRIECVDQIDVTFHQSIFTRHAQLKIMMQLFDVLIHFQHGGTLWVGATIFIRVVVKNLEQISSIWLTWQNLTSHYH